MKARTLPKGLLPSFVAAGITLITTLPAFSEVIIHRYSFNEAPGSTTVIDSISGSNGVARTRINGSFAFDGTKVTLTPGTANTQGGYIDLPNGLVSGLTNVALEFWVTWTAGGTWARILDFGAFNTGTEDPDGTAATGSGTGNNYMFLAATAGATPRFTLTPASNGAAENPVLNSPFALSQGVEHHIVVNYGPDAAEMYIDGTNVATGAYATPLSALQDVNNWLGRSQWGDPNFGGNFNEFRMHDGVLHPAEVQAHRASGPNGPVNVSTPRLTNVSPANKTIFASAAGGLSFTATSTAAIETNDIKVTVNGVNVSPELQITGTPTSRQVTYNLQANRPYSVEIAVTNSTGLQVETLVFDTFVEASTAAIEAENFNFDGGQFLTNPVVSLDPLLNTYFQRGSQLGVSNVDFVELNAGTRPTTVVGEWRHNAAAGLPQTDDSADIQRQAYTSSSVPDYDLVNIVAGEWLNYTRDFGAAANYRVYLRATATGDRTMQLDKVTGDRTKTNQATTLLGNFNLGVGGYGYAQLLGPDGKDMVVSLSGIQTLRLTAIVANNNLSINTLRFAPTTDAATVIGPYISARSPVPNSNSARPDLITATITDRETTLASGTVQLRVDGNLVVATVTPTATGANVSYAVSPVFVTNTTHTAELRYNDTLGNGFTNQWSFTISTDVQGPLLAFTAGNAAGAQSKLRVYFSEPVDPTTAGATSNYTSGGGVTFSAAAMLGNQAVELTASGVAEGNIYTLTVNRVTDAIGNPIISNSTIKYNLSRFEQHANGALVIEAESYHTNTAGAVGSSWANLSFGHVYPSGFIGGGAINTDASGNWPTPPNDGVDSAARMDYRVNFAQTGAYEIWIRGMSADGGDSFYIGLDGVMFGAITGIGGSWEWDNNAQDATTTNIFVVDTAGQHTINVWNREDGSRLDRFAIIPEPTAPANFGFADNSTTLPGPAQSRRTGDPVPPVITLSSPTTGTKVAAGANVVINVGVTDPDSATHVVEFFVNGTKAGEDTTSPYSFTVSGLADGYYSLSASATDPDNLTTPSSVVPIQVGSPKPRVLFVVGNVTLSASDAMVKARMESMGFEVIVVAAAASQTADSILKEVVVESSTVASGDVGTKFQLVPVPVLNFEEANQDEYLGTTGADRGTSGGHTNVVIVNSAHPMAAGLSGTVNVYGAAQTVGYGIPTASATIIAASEITPNQALIYGFDTGALLVDGATTAPARRVFMFPLDTFTALTPNGVKLWDAALSWAVGRTLVVAPARPTLSFSKTGDQLTLSWPVSAGNFTLKTSSVLGTGASWSSAGTPTVVGSNNQVTVPTTAPAAYYRLEQ